jgi:hypothetical protein
VSEGIPQGKTLAVREDMPEGMKVLEQVTEGQVPPDALSMYNILDRETNSSALSNEVRQGLLPAKQVRATEVVEASQSSAVVLDSLVGDMEEGLNDVLRKAYLTVLQNVDDLSTLDLQNALTNREMLALARMTPAERYLLLGSGCRLKVNGLSATLAKARDFMRLMAILQAASQNILLQGAAIRRLSPSKLWDQLLKMANINPKSVERDEEELAQIPEDIEMAALINAVQQIGGAGGGQGGAQAQTPVEGEPSLPTEIDQASSPSGGL